MCMSTRYGFFATNEDKDLINQNIEVFSYPMGDITVRRVKETELVGGDQVLLVQGTSVDWTIVAAWASMVRDTMGADVRRVLILPYLPSARGDKDTPAPACINALFAAYSGITDLITVDPHSPVWLDALRGGNPDIRIKVIEAEELISEAMENGQMATVAHLSGVIAPDAGAADRAGRVAKMLGVPLYTAEKHRNPETGRLSGYRLDPGVVDGKYLVVDDIFDGGGTFGLLADSVPASVSLRLWVTHGGFTGPMFSEKVRAKYHTVYTSSSLAVGGAAMRTDDYSGPTKTVVVSLKSSVANAVREVLSDSDGKPEPQEGD